MRLAATVLAALALLLTACGGDEGGEGGGGGAGSTPAALLTSAITRAEDTDSYESTFKLTSDLGGTRIEGSGRLISNADSTKGRGPVKFTQNGEEIAFEMILVDDQMYMRSDALADALPKGKTWMRVQDDQFAQQSLTPNQFVELLRDTPEVQEVGREEVRGKPTVHLRGPLDIKEAADRVGSGPIAALVEQQPQLVERMNAVVDVWIGEEDDRLERVALELGVDGEQGTMRFSGDMLKENVSLDSVKAPPSAQVIDDSDVPGAG